MPEVLDRFRSSTWGWLRGTLVGWLTLLLCLVGVGFLIILVQWIRFLDVTSELTEDRLILRKGIFVKSIDEIELYRVKDVRMDFTLVNQWAGIGTISVDSSRPLDSKSSSRAHSARSVGGKSWFFNRENASP